MGNEFKIEDNTPPETYSDRHGEIKHTNHRNFKTRYRGVWNGMKTKFYPTQEQAMTAIQKRTARVRAVMSLFGYSHG